MYCSAGLLLQIRLLHHLRFGFVAFRLAHGEKPVTLASVHPFTSVVSRLAIGFSLTGIHTLAVDRGFGSYRRGGNTYRHEHARRGGSEGYPSHFFYSAHRKASS